MIRSQHLIAKLSEISLSIVDTKANQAVINNNKNFGKIEARSGYERRQCEDDVLTCMDCPAENGICQRNVNVATDEEKKALVVIGDDGRCLRCPGRCDWKRHTIDGYVYEPTTVVERVEMRVLRLKYAKLVSELSNSNALIYVYLEQIINIINDLESY